MFIEWLKQNRDLITAFNKDIFPDINNRSAWDNVSPHFKDIILESAKKYKDYSWPICRAYDYRRFQMIEGDRKSYEKVHFERRAALKTLVLAQCLLGKEDETYKPDILNGIIAICEESYWDVSAHNISADYKEPHVMLIPDRLHPNIALFAAETGSLMALTMHLLADCFDEISKPLWERVRFEIKERILDQFLGDNFYWWMGLNGNFVNNWNPWIIGNIASCILLCSENNDEIQKGMWKSFYLLDNYYNAIPQDGGCDEGTTYWFCAGNGLFQALYTWYHATYGVINFFEDEKIKRIGHYIVSMHVSDNYFFNFGDGSHNCTANPFYIALFGKYIKDYEMISLGNSLTAGYKKENLFYGSRELGGLEFRFNLKGVLQQIFETIPETVNNANCNNEALLSDLQVAKICQDSDGNGFIIGAKGGNNDESHNHNDVGSFIAYLNGKPLLIDPGVESYSAKTFGSQRYDIWTMQSSWHNLPTVNGEMQKKGKSFCARAFELQNTVEGSCINISFADAYSRDAYLKCLNRSILLNRGANTIVLTDLFDFSKEENRIEEHFITVFKPQIRGNIIVLFDGNVEVAEMDCQNDSVKIKTEEREITDNKLQREWGDVIYRITYTASSKGNMNFNLQIRQK